MRVLVCEDDLVVQKFIQVTLQSENIEVVLAKDGREALRILKDNNNFNLIITDIHMPHNNGDEILQLVRNEQAKTTPIIMLSSDGEEEVIALALKLGVDQFLVKPVEATTLIKKVKKLLKP